MTNNTNKVTLTVGEVAEILRVSTIKVYDMVKNNEIPSIKIGRSLRIPSEPFMKWLNCDELNPSFKI